MNIKKQQDLSFGLSNEKKQKNKLENHFGILTKTKDIYDHFDYFNNNYFLELKSRRINHNQYSSLIFDKCKYDKGLELIDKGYRVIFVWDCIDKMVWWELKKNDKQSYFKTGGRCDRGKDEYSKLCNVPTRFLNDISTFS